MLTKFGSGIPFLKIRACYVLCRLMTVALAGLGALPAVADLVSPYGGETAPNFAELLVLEDRVRVALEIDPSDYPIFVAESVDPDASLAKRTGRTLTVAVDGAQVEPEIRVVDVRARKPRVRTARPAVSEPPRSAQVIHVEMDFGFEGRPKSVRFSPPLDSDGLPRASIGMLAEHLGVPVTDFRYLSQPETLRLDWADPWFSAFENPNLTRHHISPLMSFLTVEPREVRQEVILRIRDLEDWTDLDLGDKRMLDAAVMEAVKEKAVAFFSSLPPLEIDGAARTASRVRVSQIAVGAEGLRVLDDMAATDRSTALFGVILSYPQQGLPHNVTMRWDLFPEGVESVPVTLTDPAGGVPAAVRRDDRAVTWRNYLKTWEDPRSSPVVLDAGRSLRVPVLSLALVLSACAAAWAAIAGHARHGMVASVTVASALVAAALLLPVRIVVPLAGAQTLKPENAQIVMTAMLENIATAMLETEPAAFESALEPFVAPASISEAGAEMMRGLSVTLPSGARGHTESIGAVAVEEVRPFQDGAGTEVLASWTASVTGGHWGHLHRRNVTYRGLADLREERGAWYLEGLTILSARTDR